MMHRRLAPVVLSLALAGCADDEDPVAAPLVGSWTPCDTGGVQFAFGSDGSFELDNSGDPEASSVGTYTADATTIRAVGVTADDQEAHYEWTYYITDESEERMLFPAMRPVGDHDGIVGTWEFLLEIWSAEEHGSGHTLELRADGTGTLTWFDLDGEVWQVFEGTWEENPAGGHDFSHERELARAAAGGGTTTETFHLELFDDDVLGDPSLCRE